VDRDGRDASLCLRNFTWGDRGRSGRTNASVDGVFQRM
jgi:hypothetical protein